MLKQLWCPENNRVTVCVDTYENGVPTGRFYNSLQETESFSSLSQLLIRMETMLDDQRTPQSYAAHRTFTVMMDQLEEACPVVSRKGIRATFELKILFRQHASWQGTVVWKEQKREESFRSVLELIYLLDSALRACVRQAPDVILLGEMRDPETIHTAISAAEIGHLVIATLHTRGAVNAIDRIIDAFPSGQQAQIRVQLASVLRTVVSQQLLPDTRGGQIPACEILQVTPAVRSMIRDNKNHQIDNAIASGGRDGMVSMDQTIAALCRDGRISRETALQYADHPEQLERILAGR